MLTFTSTCLLTLYSLAEDFHLFHCIFIPLLISIMMPVFILGDIVIHIDDLPHNSSLSSLTSSSLTITFPPPQPPTIRSHPGLFNVNNYSTLKSSTLAFHVLTTLHFSSFSLPILLLKPSLKDLSMGNEHNCTIFEHPLALPFFGIGMKTKTFPVLWPLQTFPNLLTY